MLPIRHTDKCCLWLWRERRRSAEKLLRIFAPSVLTVMLMAACGEDDQAKMPAPPEVGVVTVKAEPTPLRTQLPGRAVASVTSEVRPQVTGIIRSVPFKEGATVRAGQTLYEIDDAPFRATVAQTTAALASAEATVLSTRARAERFGLLVRNGGVSKQDADDAEAAYRQAVANVGQAKANLQSAQINLDYTKVKAPITGRIGRTFFTQGALVTAGQTQALSSIQALDPIFVDITQSSADMLRLTRALTSGGVVPTRAPVTLTLPDGSEYGRGGTLEFSEPVVDPQTGSVTLRATFPNPDALLLPGMYVQANVTEAVDPNAILVPQQAVSRNQRGQPVALVVGAGNKVEERMLETRQTLGDKWVVTSGLSAGERVIVEGSQRARPGAVVNPVEGGTPATVAGPSPPPAGNGG
jgi:membrane fusion protein (multidrug efflux system)